MRFSIDVGSELELRRVWYLLGPASGLRGAVTRQSAIGEKKSIDDRDSRTSRELS